MATKYRTGTAWGLQWTNPHTGKRARRIIGHEPAITERDAEIARVALEYELITGDVVTTLNQRPDSVQWSDFAWRYLEWHRGAYPASHWRTELIVTKHLAPRFEGLRLTDITMELAEQYVARRARSVVPSTVLKELRTLKAMVNKAIDWRLLPFNPISRVRAPPNLESAPVLFYSKDELQRIYAAANEYHGAVWKLFANTGLRRQEALNLQWSDVSDAAITVRSERTARTKSGRWRHVPLSPGAAAALARLDRPADRGAQGGSRYVLHRITPHAITRAFARDLSEAGLTGSLHTLRHTFASHLVMAGRPLFEVRALLGHASITTTEIYAHLAPGHLQSAVSNISL